MAGLDQVMQAELVKFGVSGGSLAVAYNGRLVFAHGYGCADVQSNTPVQPDSLFRIASVSKTFTAVAILELVQQGKLSLDTSVFGLILKDYQPLPGKTINPELLKITVRDLLQHSGGWDRSSVQRFDGVPYQEPIDGLVAAAAQAVGHPAPSTDSDVIRVMLSQPLQHAPGTYYAYSNFGYMLLGRVIEHVTGISYEQYVDQNVLKPLGIGRQKLGATLQSDTANGEVTYYDPAGAALVKSVFPEAGGPVPAPYGGHFMEDVDAAGGWVTDAVDLTRYLNGIDGRGGGTALLTPATIATMTTDPKLSNQRGAGFYGLGFSFMPSGGSFLWSKDGALPGTTSYVVHSPSGFTWAVLFNGNPGLDNTSAASEDSSGAFVADVVGQIQAALAQLNTTTIPRDDQYANFKSTLLTPTFSATEPAVVNGATFQVGIVPGSWVTIRGQNLATATRIWWNNEIVGPNLPTEIDHVRVTINGKDAAVYYVSPTQLNVQAPSDTTTGPVTVQVIRDGTPSAVIQANYVPAAPGFFMYTVNGTNFADAVHANGSYVGNIAGTVPAKPGETIELFATGLGPTTGGIVPGATPLTPLPVITIGGLPATVSYAGLIYPGEWQLNVLVPQVKGGEQPITIGFGGASGTVATFLAVASN